MKNTLKGFMIAIILFLMATAPAYGKTKTYGNMSVKTTKTSSGVYKAKVFWKGERIVTYKFNCKPKVRFVHSDLVNYDKLTNRKGKVLYILIDYGTCLDYEGNGRIDTIDPVYNYISYRHINGIKPGDRIVTYEVMNPYSNYDDDIAERYDAFLK